MRRTPYLLSYDAAVPRRLTGLVDLDSVRHHPHQAALRPQPELPALEQTPQPGFHHAFGRLAEHDVENASLGRVGDEHDPLALGYFGLLLHDFDGAVKAAQLVD